MYCISDSPRPFYERDRDERCFSEKDSIGGGAEMRDNRDERITSKCAQSDFITFTDAGYNKET